MCYSANQSIFAFVVNVMSCLITFTLLFKNTTPLKGELLAITVFFLYVGVMQFWDALFWLNKKSSLVNRVATKVAMLWNNLEPLVLALAIVYILGKPLENVSRLLVILYTICFLIYSFLGFLILDGKGTGQTSKSGDSLFWEWNYFPDSGSFYRLFLLTMLTLVYQHFTGWIKWLSLLLLFTSFLFSFLKYEIVQSTGRYWCYFAAFVPIIYTIIYSIDSSKTG